MRGTPTNFAELYQSIRYFVFRAYNKTEMPIIILNTKYVYVHSYMYTYTMYYI